MKNKTKTKKAATYNVADAKARFSSVVREALAGYEVIISRDNKPLVKIVPLTSAGSRTPGTAKGLVRMAPDFEEPLDDFAQYR